MTISSDKLRIEQSPRYRYTKWRWRMLAHALDTVGGLLFSIWRWFRPVPQIASPRRILVVQLDHLGDGILSSPIFPLLRSRYPDAQLHVLASTSNAALFEADPHIDQVLIARRTWFERRRHAWALGSAIWELSRTVRSGRYDIGIDVRGDVLTVLVLALAGIPRRLGWSMGGGGFLLTDRAAWVRGRHEVRSRLALIQELGITPQESTRVSAYPTDADRAFIADILETRWRPHAPARSTSPARPLATRRSLMHAPAMLHAGTPHRFTRSGSIDHPPIPPPPDPERLHAGRFGAEAPLLAIHLGAGTIAKRWPIAHWQRLTDRFLEEGWRIVIVGDAEDLSLAAELPPHPDRLDLTARLTVMQTAALLERADFFIGADSAPAHLAACAGTPSLILFSGTNHVSQWRPWSRRSLVLRHRVSCRPCHRKICPLAGHPCMSGISPQRVHHTAKRWWTKLHGSLSPHAPF
jgi:heptosyltransferase-2